MRAGVRVDRRDVHAALREAPVRGSHMRVLSLVPAAALATAALNDFRGGQDPVDDRLAQR